MASEQLHEDPDALGPQTLDRHRAIASLMEELEAIDWYDQRIAATTDGELAEVLRHNRDEEKEHAAMVLEWLRRHDETLAEELRTYLFKDGPIGHAEDEGDEQAPTRPSGSLGIGSLRADATDEEGER